MKASNMVTVNIRNHRMMMAGMDAMAHLIMKRHIAAMLISTSVTTTD